MISDAERDESRRFVEQWLKEHPQPDPRETPESPDGKERAVNAAPERRNRKESR